MKLINVPCQVFEAMPVARLFYNRLVAKSEHVVSIHDRDFSLEFISVHSAGITYSL